MAAKKKNVGDDGLMRNESIKRLVVIAMFSDDLLLERLVLKGGNALDLIHCISTRASCDLDFSMQGDFTRDELDHVKVRLETSIRRTLGEAGLIVFDLKMEEVPEGLTADLADFWGGYDVEFKVIEQQTFRELNGELEAIRKRALKLGSGEGTKFSIDISKYEFIEGKESKELSGFRVFVYSPAMMVCEKLRAICQQMPEYGPVVKRNRAGSARARDFVDIHTLVTECNLNMRSKPTQELLSQIFLAKKVPVALLSLMFKYREFHSENFLSVRDTVKPGVVLQSFNFYFDYVLELVSQLCTPGNGRNAV